MKIPTEEFELGRQFPLSLCVLARNVIDGWPPTQSFKIDLSAHAKVLHSQGWEDLWLSDFHQHQSCFF
jgi:hypothetical protein